MLVLVARARDVVVDGQSANSADASNVNRRRFEAAARVHNAVAPDADCEVSKTRDAFRANANRARGEMIRRRGLQVRNHIVAQRDVVWVQKACL